MTVEQGLHLVWAETGGVTDPGDVKYQTGWIAEIPTYQNFNWVLQNATKNMLAFAENGELAWNAAIDYTPGAVVIEGGIRYYCHTANLNQQPSLDTLWNYWMKSPKYGIAAPSSTDVAKGMHLYGASTGAADFNWGGSDLTISGHKPIISLVGATTNWLIMNINSELGVANMGAVSEPDGSALNFSGSHVHRLFHEGHPPNQSEVSGTIPQEPQDGILYARRDDAWIEVAQTTVSTAPPPAVQGAGGQWYNLDDGQFYIDINDGDSSQWVPTSPPNVIDFSGPLETIVDADQINFEDASDGLARKSITFADFKQEMVDFFYPIGFIMTTATATNPGTLYPGTTWVAASEGRVMIGVGTGTDINAVDLTVAGGDTGGEYAHTQSLTEMVSHMHRMKFDFDAASGSGATVVRNSTNGTGGTRRETSYSGGDGNTSNDKDPAPNQDAANVTQPYLGVYIWQRTA